MAVRWLSHTVAYQGASNVFPCLPPVTARRVVAAHGGGSDAAAGASIRVEAGGLPSRRLEASGAPASLATGEDAGAGAGAAAAAAYGAYSYATLPTGAVLGTAPGASRRVERPTPLGDCCQVGRASPAACSIDPVGGAVRPG